MKKLLFGIIVLLFSASSFAATPAIHYDPLDGGWFPADTFSVMLYGVHGSGNTWFTEGDINNTGRNVTFEKNIGVVRVATWQELGTMWHFSVVVPTGDVQMSGAPITPPTGASASGMADWEIVVSPRLAEWGSGYLNFGLSTFVPLGTYEHNSILNMGDNRWSFRPTLALGQNVGKFHFDFWLGYDYYMDNDNFGPTKLTLKKDGDYFTELHATYIILPESMTYGSLSFGYIGGGKEEVEGIEIVSDLGDYAVKATFGMNVTESLSFMINYAYDLHVENGPKSYTAAVRLMKVF